MMMLKINNWKELEEFGKELISYDNPRLPPGSGNAKHEEDVVGDTIIMQCKYTDNKNSSILSNDLDRLNKSADLLTRVPIFVNKSENTISISISITDNNIGDVQDILKLLSIKKTINKLDNYIENMDIGDISGIQSIVNKSKKQWEKLKLKIESKYEKADIKLKCALDDLMITNLFEGDSNAIK
jgi:hypothetical protein